MDKILESIHSPMWWFQAIIIAILTSVFAGFTKDWLERKFSLFLNTSKIKRQEKKENDELVISSWSKSEILVTIVLIKNVMWLILMFSMQLLTFMYVFYLDQMLKFKGINTDVMVNLYNLPTKSILVLSFLLVLNSVSAFFTIKGSNTATKIFIAFRKSRSLPKIL